MKASSSIIICILGFFILQSCQKDEVDIDPFNQEYFYYTFNYEKIPLYLKGSEVYIEFNHNLSYYEIIRLLRKYDFIKIPANANITERSKSIRCEINAKDTIQLLNILRTLNKDSIHYAMPVFTFIKNDPKSFAIPTNTINCDPLVSKEELIKLISKYNLLITKSKPEHLYYLLEIKKINTGFESIEIANSLYETGKFTYCCPDLLSQGIILLSDFTSD